MQRQRVRVEVGRDSHRGLIVAPVQREEHLGGDSDALHGEAGVDVALLGGFGLDVRYIAVHRHSANAVGASEGGVEGYLHGAPVVVHQHEVGVGVDVGGFPALEDDLVGLQHELPALDGGHCRLVHQAVQVGGLRFLAGAFGVALCFLCRFVVSVVFLGVGGVGAGHGHQCHEGECDKLFHTCFCV